MNFTPAQRRRIERGFCPWCSAGPFDRPHGHYSQAHGIDHLTIKRALGLPLRKSASLEPLTSTRKSKPAQRRIPLDWWCEHCGGDDGAVHACPCRCGKYVCGRCHRLGGHPPPLQPRRGRPKAQPEPPVCVCDEPRADAFGQCATCHLPHGETFAAVRAAWRGEKVS